MRLFICGGGAGKQTEKANLKLNEIIDHTKPILYIPLAMSSEKYDSCYEWIKGELSKVLVPGIEMVRTPQDILDKDLDNYSCIFIGGGNTFKLLNDLKKSGAFLKIKEYMENDGIVYGGSAGAIILGSSIDTCEVMDKNEVGLIDLEGYNELNQMGIACHFTNGKKAETLLQVEAYKKISKDHRVIALPEEVTIYYENGSYLALGDRPYYIFEDGIMITMGDPLKRKQEFLGIRTCSDLMNFLNENIAYGWIDKSEKQHISNLKYFREIYRTSSLEEILRTGLGTCIEQAKLIKYVLDKLGFETRMYCLRRYETEDNFDKEVKMHCFVLFTDNGKWYHFEHSNIPRRGILEYETLEEAIKSEIDRHEVTDVRELTEISNVPEGLSFKEFNEYVNQFDHKKLKK